MQTNTRLHTATHRTTIFSGMSWPGLRAETGRDDINFRQPACNVYSHKLRLFVLSRHFLLCFPGFYFVLRYSALLLVFSGLTVLKKKRGGNKKEELWLCSGERRSESKRTRRRVSGQGDETGAACAALQLQPGAVPAPAH
jgi:hypothetical protein